MSSREPAVAEAVTAGRSRVPLAWKIGFSLFTVATFAAYGTFYSFAHTFLWFCSLALLITSIALWLESSLLVSMQAVGVVLLDLVYGLDFVVRLVTGVFITGLSVYIFEADDAPWWARAFSLFHLPLPFVLLWLVHRLGYDRRGWLLQTALTWVILPIIYFFTNPDDNVNWVFGPTGPAREWLPPWGWCILLMIAFPALIYFPSHLALAKWFRPKAPSPASAANPLPGEVAPFRN